MFCISAKGVSFPQLYGTSVRPVLTVRWLVEGYGVMMPFSVLVGGEGGENITVIWCIRGVMAAASLFSLNDCLGS